MYAYILIGPLLHSVVTALALALKLSPEGHPTPGTPLLGHSALHVQHSLAAITGSQRQAHAGWRELHNGYDEADGAAGPKEAGYIQAFVEAYDNDEQDVDWPVNKRRESCEVNVSVRTQCAMAKGSRVTAVTTHRSLVEDGGLDVHSNIVHLFDIMHTASSKKSIGGL